MSVRDYTWSTQDERLYRDDRPVCPLDLVEDAIDLQEDYDDLLARYDELVSAMDRSGYGIGPCAVCERPAVFRPDWLPLCMDCRDEL